MGSDERFNYSVLGDSVNVCSRIEGQTKSLDVPVLASASFAEAAPSEWPTAGEIEIPDFDKRMEVFTLPEVLPASTEERQSTRTPAE